MNDVFRPHTETIAKMIVVWIFGLEIPTRTTKARRELMRNLRFIFAAASALAIGGGLAVGTAQAMVPGEADALRAAAENGAITEQAQFRWGGNGYCWYADGWRGPGWYWCGYAYRPGFGWGGQFGGNNWRFRDHDEFREHEFREHERGEFREHERGEFRERERGEFREHHEHDERRRY
jgi:hypothetical protein